MKPYLAFAALLAMFAIMTVPANAVAMDCTNLDMLAKGSIYSPTGEAVQTNVWFTVYPAEDRTYVVGTNEVNVVGAIMVWGNTGEPDDITGPQKYISLALGQTLVIDRLYRSGSSVTSYTLTTSSPSYTVPTEFSPITPPQIEEPDNDGLGLYPILVVGAACVLIAVMVVEYRRYRKK